jgi:hypothetical protein
MKIGIATRIASVVVLATATLLAVSAPANASSTASISGTVRSAATGLPDAGVTVTLVGEITNFFGTGPAIRGQTSTAADGTYSFTGLTASADYQVCFAGDGAASADEGQCYNHITWFPQLGDSSPAGFDYVPGQAIAVADGQQVGGIDAAMVVAATLNGTVTSAATGQPVSASVTVDNSQFLGSANTASDGTYSVKVPADASGYQVCFAPTYAYLPACVTSGPVASGQQVMGVSAALAANSTAISGTVTLADTSKAAAGVTATLFFMDGGTNEFGQPIGQVQATTTTAPDGSYAFTALPTNGSQYDVCFTPPGTAAISAYLPQCYLNTAWDSPPPPSDGQYPMPSTATLVSPAIGQHLAGIDAALAANHTAISGRVTQSPLGNPLGNVKVDLLGPTATVLASTTTDRSGRYTITGLRTSAFYVCFDAAHATGGLTLNGYFDQCWKNTAWAGSGAAPAGSTPITPALNTTTPAINAAIRARL